MANSAMERRREQREREFEQNKAAAAEFNQQDEQDVPPVDDSTEETESESTMTREQVERLQSKTASLEKKLAAMEKENAQLENPPKPEKTQAELDKELEKELREEIGADNWDFMDDASKKAVLAIAKRSAKKEPQAAIKDEVDAAFKTRDDQERSKDFVNKLDDELRARNYRYKFVTLVNSEQFARWMDKSRKNIAIFEDAMKHRDKEAVRDMMALVDEYLQSKDKSNNTTPSAASNKGKPPVQKSNVITQEQYEQALRDKRHPSRRERARKVIALFKEQQNG